MERFNLLVNNFDTLNKELKIVSDQLKKENDDFFNAIVEHSTNFIAIVQDEKYVFVNAQALNLFRCTSSADIIGKDISETIHPDYHNIVILGYDHNKKQFIVHDVGTQFGAYFKYSYKVLLESLADFQGPPRVLLLLK